MKTRLFCNDLEAPVSPFVGRFIANICIAISRSLKTAEGKNILFTLSGDRVGLEIDGLPVPLDLSQGFAETLVRDTLGGMLQHLKGMDAKGRIRIEIENI
jgi:hypothetical protein